MLDFANTTESSRRMDIESLGQLLVYLATGTLPWLDKVEKISNITPDQCAEVGKFKEQFTPEILCTGLPKCIETLLQARNLAHTDEPKYDQLKTEFLNSITLQPYSFPFSYSKRKEDPESLPGSKKSKPEK